MTAALQAATRLPASAVVDLLRQLPALGDTTTVILHGGCVFEYKGPFPTGSIAAGCYNLQGSRPGFEGHLRLDAMAAVSFQDRPHRGRASFAFVFEDSDGKPIFKVFLGRDADGEVFPQQLEFFRAVRAGAAAHAPSASPPSPEPKSPQPQESNS